LESGALATAEFKTFAEDVVLFCHITTRIPDHPYDGLLRATGGKFFPTLLFMDGMGKVVGWVDIFDGLTVEKFRAAHSNTKRRLALLDKEKPTAAEKTELFLLDAKLLMMDYDAAKERVADLGKLEGDAAKRVAEVMVNFEAEDHMNPRPRGMEAVKEVGEAFYKMAKAGRIPTKSGLAGGFWSYMFAWADAEKNVEAMKYVVGEYGKLAETDERAKRMLGRMKERLKAAEGAAK
jgi:hypothetical protein